MGCGRNRLLAWPAEEMRAWPIRDWRRKLKAGNSLLVAVETHKWGKIVMQNTLPKLSETPGTIRTPAPGSVGQDNDYVLGKLLGLSSQIQAALRSAGAI
jgi:crotonobetainyl-CoA:carnitine CoA-transferase CaiB-like acyl-CoA transferase